MYDTCIDKSVHSMTATTLLMRNVIEKSSHSLVSSGKIHIVILNFTQIMQGEQSDQSRRPNLWGRII